MWREVNDGATERLSGQYLGAGSVALSAVFRVTSDNQSTDRVAVASDGQGNALAVWDSQGGVGRRRIFGRRYQVAAVPTVAPTATPTPGPPLPACVGDCDGDRRVTIDEAVMGVNIALGNAAINACPSLECNGAVAGVFVNCLLTAVHNALVGCPAP